MRKIISGALLAASFGAMAQTPAQFAENAKKVVDQFKEKIVIKEDSPGKWYRTSSRLGETSWDVKKTDSLLNPVQAFVRTTFVTAGTNVHPTKADAEAAPMLPSDDVKVELNFVPTANGWAYSDGRLYADTLRTWIPIDYKLCAARPIFTCAVIDAFSVKK